MRAATRLKTPPSRKSLPACEGFPRPGGSPAYFFLGQIAPAVAREPTGGSPNYFLPDNRSINEANFEPFLSTLTRRWRTPVSFEASFVISSVCAPRISRV
jgi:hypothetical protein